MPNRCDLFRTDNVIWVRIRARNGKVNALPALDGRSLKSARSACRILGIGPIWPPDEEMGVSPENSTQPEKDR